MTIAARVVLARGGGLARGRDLREAGVDDAELLRWQRSEELVRVRPRVFVDGELWRGAVPGPARELVRARAAALVSPGPFSLSHDSAAHLLGIAFLSEPDPWVHLTRPGVHGARHLLGVKQHVAPHPPGQRVLVQGLPTLDAARTAVDLARYLGVRSGIGACDSALRLGVTAEALTEVLAPMKSWPHVKPARECVTWCDPGAENPGESLARLAVLESGFGRPVTQFPVDLGGRLVWADIRIGSHLVEFDGRLKYQPVEAGGVAGSDPGDVVWRERQRERALLQRGFGVSRLVWDDLLPKRWAGTVARLRAEIEETFARVGPHPAPQHLETAARLESTRLRRICRAARIA